MALITTEDWLFFITNLSGQAYYVDPHGNVSTCSVVDLRAWLRSAPDGWLQQQTKFDRKKENWSFNRTYAAPLKFVNDGAIILRYLMYQQQGIETPAFFTVLKYDPALGYYDTYYQFGEIDLSQPDDFPVSDVTVNIIEGGLLKILKSFEKDIIQIPLDGSIAQNVVIDMQGLMFQAQFIYGIIPVQMKAKGVFVPFVLQSSQGNDVGIQKGSQTYQEFDPTNLGTFNQLLADSINTGMISQNPLTNVNIAGPLTFAGNLVNGCLVVWTSLNNVYPLVNTIDPGTRVPTGAIVAGAIYDVNVTIPLLAAGEIPFVFMITSDGTFDFFFNALPFDITFNSQFEDTTTIGIRPFDALTLILQGICYKAFPYPQNKVYTVSSNLLQQYAHIVMTSGAALRNEANATLKTSIGEFFQAYDALFCAAMGSLGVPDYPGEILSFEKVSSVMDPSAITLELGEVSEFHIKPATDLISNGIEIGYEEQKFDEKQGNIDWMTTLQLRGPVMRGSTSKYSKICPYIGSPWAAEYVRFLVGTSNNTNNKSDNKTFILNVDFSQVENAVATAYGTLGQYYGSGFRQPDALQGTNRGQFMQWHNINGTGIATDLAILTRQSPGDTLGYTGVNDTVTMTLSCQVTFRGDLSIHYYNTTDFLGSVHKHKELIGPGVYNAQFNLYRGNALIFTQPLLLFGGAIYDFNINNVFSNLDFVFGDYYQADITYTAGNDTDGLCLIFNLTNLSLVFQDNNTIPVYKLLKKVYDSDTLPVGTSQFAYNIEDISPARILQNHSGFLAGSYYFQQNQNIAFQNLDKNQTLSTTLSGVTVTENSDVPVVSLRDPALFLPFYFRFMTKIPLMANKVFTGAINGHVHGTFNGIDLWCFPTSVSIKPGLEEAQEWVGLASPLNNPADFLDMTYSGLENLDPMAFGLTTPKTCPIKSYELGYVAPAQYNFIHIDQDWFINQIGFYPFQYNYFAKWQTNDIWSLMRYTSGLGAPTDTIIDCTGETIDTIEYTLVDDTAMLPIAPWQCWVASYEVSSLPPGQYWIKTTAGTGSSQVALLSEGLDVQTKWPVTHLFNYYDTQNRQGTIFSSGYQGSFRCEGYIDDYDPEANVSQYEDQPANIVNLDGIPFLSATLNIGNADSGVPPWVRILVQRIMILNNVTIDGKQFTPGKGAKWERNTPQGSPLGWAKLQIRETQNLDMDIVTTTGGNNGDLTVEYGINTSAFGPGGTVVQVTKVGP